MCAQTSKNLNQQLGLTFEPPDEYTFELFFWGKNDLLKSKLTLFSENFYYIWGKAGVGKTHLLQAACLAFTTSAVYLPLSILKSLGCEVLEGIEHQNLIVIDDIEAIAGDTHWEEALFHLFNKVRSCPEKILIISSHESPAQSSLHLPDLKSRLYWGLTAQLHPLHDQEKSLALEAYAKKRGFILPARVALFLIQHVDRDMHHLIELLKMIDHASLAAQRKITIPFVKQILTAQAETVEK